MFSNTKFFCVNGAYFCGPNHGRDLMPAQHFIEDVSQAANLCGRFQSFLKALVKASIELGRDPSGSTLLQFAQPYLDYPVCVVCSAPADKKCSKCRCTYYCSADCQKANWRAGHKEDCANRRKVRKEGKYKTKKIWS